MPENRDDRMMLTLDALRSDVERTPLADSLTVRRRGDQRTRRQAVGGALAVVALVAGAVGLYGGLDGDQRATQIPASPSPSVEQTLDLAADPFLRESDVTDIGPYSMLRSPDSADALAEKKLQCMPDIAGLGAAQTEGQFFYSDLDGSFSEHVLRFASADQATGAVADLETAFADCPEGDPAEVTVQDRPPAPVAGVPGADEALQASRTGTPKQASEISYYELGVVREANVVVVLQWSSMGQPTDVDWVWDAERLTAALDRAIH